MPRCHISLGGNLGPVAETFDRALDRLQQVIGCSPVAVSRFHRTAAVGLDAGSEFLNAAAELETTLKPFDLLDLLQTVEIELGRERTVHWGPRTLDLDLLFYGAEVISSPRLVVPHPAAWYRRFVLDPLTEIAPSLVHPTKGISIQRLRERLLARPLQVAFTGGTAERRTAMTTHLSAIFSDAEFSNWNSRVEQELLATSEPALIFWLGPPAGDLTTSRQTFQSLPSGPRIDATSAAQPIEQFVVDVVRSALGV